MEVAEESTHLGHHKQKIVLVLSAMRHFSPAWRWDVNTGCIRCL